MGLRLFFLPNFPGAMFIQGATFIPDSRVQYAFLPPFVKVWLIQGMKNSISAEKHLKWDSSLVARISVSTLMFFSRQHGLIKDHKFIDFWHWHEGKPARVVWSLPATRACCQLVSLQVFFIFYLTIITIFSFIFKSLLWIDIFEMKIWNTS